MKLNARSVFVSSWIIAAASYAICAFFVAVAPAATSQFFSYLLHIDLSSLARHITLGSFAAGIVCFSVGVAAHFGAAAWVYNRSASAG